MSAGDWMAVVVIGLLSLGTIAGLGYVFVTVARRTGKVTPAEWVKGAGDMVRGAGGCLGGVLVVVFWLALLAAAGLLIVAVLKWAWQTVFS